jgi:hypothetical protein
VCGGVCVFLSVHVWVYVCVYVCRCGRYQRNGFGDLAGTRFGLWQAFPKIISLTRRLDGHDKEMVVSKISSSAPLFSFNHLAVAHAACHRHQLLSKPTNSVSPLQLVDSSVGYVRSSLKPVGAS